MITSFGLNRCAVFVRFTFQTFAPVQMLTLFPLVAWGTFCEIIEGRLQHIPFRKKEPS
jgi:hypothetical protein